MGKIKERKSESWKPTMVQDTSFISKNKKRKERRMSQVDPSSTINLKEIADKLCMRDKQTPSKGDNSMVHSLKSKGKGNQSFSLTPNKKKKENKALSVSLPISKDKPKKENPLFSKKKKLTGILSNSNTPKKMNGKVTFKNSPESEKLIDDEAVEMEEPITDKEVKSFPAKKGKKLKQLRNSTNESSDDELSESGSGFLDDEASEGEETDDEEVNESNSENTDEDSDFEEETSDMSDFIADDDESEEENEENDQDDESEKENEEQCEEDNEHNAKTTKVDLKEKKKKKEKTKTILESSEARKPAAVTEKKSAVDKQEQISNELSKKSKDQPSVEGSDLKSTKAKKKKDEANKENKESKNAEKVSEFIGFISGLPEKINEKQIKNALSKSANPADILQLTLKRRKKQKDKRCCLVYVKDEDTLNALMTTQYKIGDINFSVSRARESSNPTKGKFVAFLPRVPVSIPDESIKQAISKELGPDSIVNFTAKKIYEKFQTRNILVELNSLDLLKKLILKEECLVDGHSIVMREAFEAGLSIPFYRVVFSNIPENTNAPALKKVIEAETGKGTILNIRFSCRKSSYAFVSFTNEDAQKKALDTGNEMSISGKKLKVYKFIPRKPKKRSSGSGKAKTEKSEQKPENKKRKLGANDKIQNSPKKVKQEKAEKPKKTKDTNKSISIESPSNKINIKKQKKKEKKTNNPESTNTEEKAKNPQIANKKEIKKKALSEKMEMKKNKLKETKNKKKIGKSN